MSYSLKFEYKVSITYLLIGGLWILFSDQVLNFFVADKQLLTTMQTYKGWFFVLVTAVFLFLFLRGYLKKLRNAERKAQETDLLKNVFIRNISHEIRTPINGILGFIELIKEQDVSVKDKIEYLQIIEKSTQDLLLTVNGMMDLSLLEVGAESLNYTAFDVKQLINSLFQQYKSFENERVSLSMEINLKEGIGFIRSDESKIKMILGHLISNAFKYTDQGFVKFGCYDENDRLVFYVIDSGVGIAKSDQSFIFENYNRHTQNNETDNVEMGLGLNISKSIVSLLGGAMWVSSALGKGSSFYFSFANSLIVSKNDLAEY
jgi:signal transduction histidine kinase